MARIHSLKTMFAYKSTECLHQLLKSQTSVCCSISLNPYMVFHTWNHEKGKEKRKAILLLAYIADVSCLTNRLFYMQTLSYKFDNILISKFEKK